MPSSSQPAEAAPNPPAPPRGLGDRILRAGASVLAANLCVRLAGFFIKNRIPNLYGLGVSDVFSVVNDTVLNSAFVVGEQCLGPAYMPVFTSARDKEGEERAWRYTSVLLNLQLIILLVLTAALILFPGPVISLFTEWGSDKLLSNSDIQDRRTLALQMLPYVAPALIGMSLASLTYWVLMGYKQFFLAAFGDALLKFSILGGAILGGVLGRGDWHFIAWGILAGGTLKLVLHLAVLGPKRLRFYRLTLNLRDKYLGDFFLLVLPLLLGIFVSLFRDVMMKRLQTVVPGLPTYFSQGRGVSDTVGFLVPFSLSIALLPFFCDIAARDDRAHLGRLLTQTIRMVVWFFVPVCVVLAVAALPVCMVIYKGEIIDATKAGYAALVMQIFCIQMPFLAVEMLVNQAFFSSRRMWAPTAVGAVLSLLAPAVAYWLVVGRGMEQLGYILVVVSLCLVLARVLKAFILIWLLKRTVPVLPLAETAACAVRFLLAGGGAAVAALAAHRLYLHFVAKALHNARLSNACDALLIGLAGAAVYLALSLLLRMEEPRLCWQWTKEKLRRRGAKPNLPAAGVEA